MVNSKDGDFINRCVDPKQAYLIVDPFLELAGNEVLD